MMRSFPRARWVALSSVVAISFLSGGWLLRPAPAAGGGVYEQARLFEHVVAAINRHYIDSVGEGDLYQRAAGALVGSLGDPYAELLVNESYREYRRQMTGTELDFDVKSGPTESGGYGRGTESGFRPGDKVLSIDGRSTAGWTARQIEEALRDGRGPTVTVVVRREPSTTTSSSFSSSAADADCHAGATLAPSAASTAMRIEVERGFVNIVSVPILL